VALRAKRSGMVKRRGVVPGPHQPADVEQPQVRLFCIPYMPRWSPGSQRDRQPSRCGTRQIDRGDTEREMRAPTDCMQPVGASAH
jgi:hypothetical protein